ncbi:MAG: protein phosphatase CheZ [Deferribacteraceae bacterium]|nr:protein phosphatase CheZ [Deferribacteraceae bacterium]
MRLLVSIKSKVDEIPPNVISSQNDLPNLSSTLTDVNAATESAANNLLASARRLEEFYNDLTKEALRLAALFKSGDIAAYDAQKEIVLKKVDDASDLGLHVLEALEFQDITEQKIRKVIRSIEEVGARLGSIVGVIRAKDIDNKDKKDYDDLLTDLGFA